jgi:hypothetical protein
MAYIAALDVHDPQRGLFGRCEPKTGIEPFGRLVEQVVTSEPYASAQYVFWIVDNGSSHCGKRSVDRLQAAWPNLVHLPVHASWLNHRDLLLDPATQSAHPAPLRQPGRTREQDHGVPGRLATRRHPDRLALHPPRPQPTP